MPAEQTLCLAMVMSSSSTIRSISRFTRTMQRLRRKFRSPNKALQLTGALLAMAVIAGCSDGRPARVPISGQVLIDGQPLKFGVVKFIPDNGRPSSGNLDENGRFTLHCFDDA